MQARLLLSAAVATLSLCLSPGYAQKAGTDQREGEAHRQTQEQYRAQEQNRERNEAQGARQSEKQNAAAAEKPGRE